MSDAEQIDAPTDGASATNAAADWHESVTFGTREHQTLALEVELELQAPAAEFTLEPVKFEETIGAEICKALDVPSTRVLIVNPEISLQRVSFVFLHGTVAIAGTTAVATPGALFLKLQNFLQMLPLSKEFTLLSRAVRVSVESAIIADRPEELAIALLGKSPIRRRPRRGDCPVGCGERIEDHSFAHHVTHECCRREVACPLSCGDRLRAEDVTRHVTSTCSERKVSCPACTESLIYKFLTLHESGSCVHRFIHCNCGEAMKFSELAPHKITTCHMRTIACSWCAETMHAFELALHKKGACSQKLTFEEKLVEAVWRRELAEVAALAADGVALDGMKAKLALHAAAAVDDIAIVNKLILCGASGRAVNPATGQTALHVAVSKGHGRIAEILLNSGQADPKVTDKSGRTAFAIAVFMDRVNMVKLLMKHGATEAELTGLSDLMLNDWIKEKLVLQFDMLNNIG